MPADPNVPDPFELYKAADMYLLERLRDRSLEQLRSCCSVQNICERLFDPTCSRYPDVQAVYMDFLVQNYDRVKQTPAWTEAFETVGLSQSELKFRTKLLFDISQRVQSPPLNNITGAVTRPARYSQGRRVNDNNSDAESSLDE